MRLHPPRRAAPGPGRHGADLHRRLRRLEDERDVLSTLHAYGPCLDYGREQAWVDCFTAEGVFDVRYEERRILLRGRSELAGFAASHSRWPAAVHKHLVVEPQITVSGHEALAASYFVRVDQLDARPTIRSFGRYLDRLVRSADGRWRFAERIAHVEARHGDLGA